MATKYTSVIVFTKKGNLSEYFTSKVEYDKCYSSEQYRRWSEHYAQEREIQLILMIRYEGAKMFCKIKCPVNPLPVKGEFEVPSYSAIFGFLKNNGWTYKQKFCTSMFE